MHSIHNARYNCSKCLDRYSGRSDHAEMIKKTQQVMACQVPSDRLLHRIGEDIGFKKCIGNFYRDGLMFWVEAQSKYESGIMPFHGPLMDQPNKAIEIFQCIQSAKYEKMESDRLAQEQRLKDKSGKSPRKVLNG